MHRRAVGAVLMTLALALPACSTDKGGSPDGASAGGPGAASSTGGQASAGGQGSEGATPSGSAATSTSSTSEEDQVPSDQTHLHFVKDVTRSKITPKSVQANGHGLLIANNMFYTHSMTLYDARTMSEKAEISDGVDLGAFGVPGHPGTSKGSPVEASWTKDGRYAYVSNYTMFGNGFDGRAQDYCGPQSGYKSSFIYRLDAEAGKIDQVIPVGVVPKFLQVTPDQKSVLVSNWCSYTVGVVDVESKKQVKQIPVGRNPRGLAISPDSTKAYVACEGGAEIYVIDLETGSAKVWLNAGEAPRSLLLSPDGKTMYATIANGDRALKIDVASAKVVDEAYVGLSPRSMDISADGTAIYTVQFDEATVTKVRTSDMAVIEKRRTKPYPIGVAYEPETRSVWVALYPGQMFVYEDTSTTDFPEEQIPATPGPVVGTGSRRYAGYGPAPSTAGTGTAGTGGASGSSSTR